MSKFHSMILISLFNIFFVLICIFFSADGKDVMNTTDIATTIPANHLSNDHDINTSPLITDSTDDAWYELHAISYDVHTYEDPSVFGGSYFSYNPTLLHINVVNGKHSEANFLGRSDVVIHKVKYSFHELENLRGMLYDTFKSDISGIRIDVWNNLIIVTIPVSDEILYKKIQDFIPNADMAVIKIAEPLALH